MQVLVQVWDRHASARCKEVSKDVTGPSQRSQLVESRVCIMHGGQLDILPNRAVANFMHGKFVHGESWLKKVWESVCFMEKICVHLLFSSLGSALDRLHDSIIMNVSGITIKIVSLAAPSLSSTSSTIPKRREAQQGARSSPHLWGTSRTHKQLTEDSTEGALDAVVLRPNHPLTQWGSRGGVHCSSRHGV